MRAGCVIIDYRLLTLGLFHSKGFGGRLLGKTDLLFAGKSGSSKSFRSRWHCALISANVLSFFIVPPAYVDLACPLYLRRRRVDHVVKTVGFVRTHSSAQNEQQRVTYRPTGCANKNNPLAKMLYFSHGSTNLRKTFRLYIRIFAQHILQILLK